MKKMLSVCIMVLLFAGAGAFAGDEAEPKAEAGKAAAKALKLLADEKLPEIESVEVKGENPQVIYIPILHDNPELIHGSAETNALIEATLGRCRKISEHLYKSYGVRNILLEGLPKSLSDKYNSPEYRSQKLSVGDSKAIIFKVWFDLLNSNRWHLVPAFEKDVFGPFTLLGAEYTDRILKVFQKAQTSGWFRSSKAFQDNKAEFDSLIDKACKGYNERREALLKEDPGLKKEYEITAVQRDKYFIDNTLAAKGPGIIMCGASHVQDLVEQLEKRKVYYMIIVPKGITWPPKKKDDDTIYQEMLKLGCQLKTCTLALGDGKSIEVAIPIK